jgi:hypothetical protein
MAQQTKISIARSDVAPEQAQDARIRALRFIFGCYERKQQTAAVCSGEEESRKDDDVSSKASAR